MAIVDITHYKDVNGTAFIHDDYIKEENVKPALENITKLLSKARIRIEAEKAEKAKKEESAKL